MKVFSHPVGDEAGEFLGYYPMSLSTRTAEEIGGDLRHTNLRLAAYAPKNRCPHGGYSRGMVLRSLVGEEEYRVLVATAVGRSWVLRLEGILFDGDSVGAEGRGIGL